MQASFDNTVQILVKAYFDGVLEATDCAACACGNLVAAANQYTIAGSNRWVLADGNPAPKTEWYEVNRHTEGQQRYFTQEGMRQVASTGYTAEQFCAIEEAFMNACGDLGDDNFSGLMAVVDVLADIHGIDLTAAEQAKALFVRA